MKKPNAFSKTLFVLLCTIFILGGCKNSKKPNSEITVFCCSTLTEVISIMADSFMLQNEADIHLNFASSGILARQLKNGAPAHIFLSASDNWMEYCRVKQLVDTTSISPLLQNSLVWVGPSITDYAQDFSVHQITSFDKIAIGDPAHVPAGNYAREYLMNTGLWADLKQSTIPCRDAKNTLFMVERAEVEYGLVYYSDALRSEKVKMLEMIPDSLHTTIQISMALVGKNQKATDFFAYLRHHSHQVFYRKYGFNTPIK